MSLMLGIIGAVVNRFANIGLGQLPGVLPVYRFVWGQFGPKGIKITEVDGMKLNVICRDWAVAPTMLFAHSWEPVETALFKKYIKTGDVVVDAGAYIGYYTVLASKLVGDSGKVYAFEPSPENADILTSNVRLNSCSNVCVVRAAVSDKSGWTTFYPNPANASGSTMFARNPRGGKIDVGVVSLDDVIGDRRVDFIKMDIEGGEAKTLEGMVGVIKNNPNLKMIVEIFPDSLKSARSNLEEFVAALQRNFRLYLVGGDETRNIGIAEISQEIKKSGVINLFCMRRTNTK